MTSAMEISSERSTSDSEARMVEVRSITTCILMAAEWTPAIAAAAPSPAPPFR
jgi:hypothetical protein